jgi:peptide/nickel transport system permease protein
LIETIVVVTTSTPRIVLSLFALMIVAVFAGSSLNIASGSVSLFIICAVAMGLPLVGVFLAQFNEQLLLTMDQDFIQLARAKGLSEWKVILRHALRPALDPVISLFGLSIGVLLGGSVVVETILGWPGIGSLMVTAVRGRDVPLVMGIVLVASVAVWLGNTVAEFLQMANDKRIRASAEN